MKHKNHRALKADKQQLAADVGKRIVGELGAGNVQEAFCHLKGCYWVALETKAAPCPQTTERQTDKRVELYVRRAAYGESFPANGTPFEIRDNEPSEGEIRAAVMEMSNGRCGGTSGIKAEQLKRWLRGAKKEE